MSEVEWAWRQLELSHGATSIRGIAERLGWTRKRLIKVFRDEIGIPPKLLARILRFRWALAECSSGKVISLSQLAAECGYSDQSHMIRISKLSQVGHQWS